MRLATSPVDSTVSVPSSAASPSSSHARRRWSSRRWVTALLTALVLAGVSSVVSPSSAGADVPAVVDVTDGAQRLVDTRPGYATADMQFAGIGRLPADSVLRVPVAGRVSSGSDLQLAVVNATVVDPSDRGYVTLFSCDDTRPVASNLNYTAGITRAVLAVVPVADDGTICVYTRSSTHLVVDASATSMEGAGNVPVGPARLLDTRPGRPTVDGRLAGGGVRPAGTSIEIPVAGRGGVPEDATKVGLSVTAVDARAPGFLLVHTCGDPLPTASTLNFGAGETIANAAFARLDARGSVCVFTYSPTDLVVDVVAAFGDDLQLLGSPARLFDSRAGRPTVDGAGVGGGPLGPGSVREIAVAGRAGIPADAGAVVLNVVAAEPQAQGHLRLYPSGTNLPNASNLNYRTGSNIANAVVVGVGADGAACVYASQTTHVVVDVVGWLPGTAASSDSDCGRPSLFPGRRIVALYGNDTAAALGVLGEQPPDEAADRLEQIAAPYRQGDRPVQGAFELIATIATAAPGPSGLYRSVSSDEHVQRYLDAAVANGLLLILDIQPGQSDFLTELRRYESFLRRPEVHVALDPEWNVDPGQVPGEVVGQVDATEVNAVAEYLSEIVVEENLPEKMLVVHQFQDRMLTNRELLREPDGIAVTIHMDGFGTQEQKLTTYEIVQAAPPFNNGFKLFFDEDIDMFTPAEVLQLDPVPDLITYQ